MADTRDISNTVIFSVKEVTAAHDAEIKRILSDVYDALEEKNYDPINQLANYILSEEPAYITNHNGARTLIRRLDRDEILKALLKSYLDKN